jgi:hypothetical protein
MNRPRAPKKGTRGAPSNANRRGPNGIRATAPSRTMRASGACRRLNPVLAPSRWEISPRTDGRRYPLVPGHEGDVRRRGQDTEDDLVRPMEGAEPGGRSRAVGTHGPSRSHEVCGNLPVGPHRRSPPPGNGAPFGQPRHVGCRQPASSARRYGPASRGAQEAFEAPSSETGLFHDGGIRGRLAGGRTPRGPGRIERRGASERSTRVWSRSSRLPKCSSAPRGASARTRRRRDRIGWRPYQTSGV